MDYANGSNVYNVRNGKWQDLKTATRVEVKAFLLGNIEQNGSQAAVVELKKSSLANKADTVSLLYVLRFTGKKIFIIGPHLCDDNANLRFISVGDGVVKAVRENEPPASGASKRSRQATLVLSYANDRLQEVTDDDVGDMTSQTQKGTKDGVRERKASVSTGKEKVVAPSGQGAGLIGNWKGGFHLTNPNSKPYRHWVSYTIYADPDDGARLKFREVDRVQFDDKNVALSCSGTNSIVNAFEGDIVFDADTVRFVQKQVTDPACGSLGVDVFKFQDGVLEIVNFNNGTITSGALQRY